MRLRRQQGAIGPTHDEGEFPGALDGIGENHRAHPTPSPEEPFYAWEQHLAHFPMVFMSMSGKSVTPLVLFTVCYRDGEITKWRPVLQLREAPRGGLMSLDRDALIMTDCRHRTRVEWARVRSSECVSQLEQCEDDTAAATQV